MPTELREHQLEMLDLTETRSLLFGTEDTGYLTLSPPAWKAGDAKDDDLERPHEDGRFFGRDLRGGGTVGFEIGVLTDWLADDVTTAYELDSDYTSALADWWDDEDFRDAPSSLAVLRECRAGRVWRAYGRPRRFEAVKTILAQQGYTPVVCDFAVIDNRVYADTPETLTIPLVAPPEGGFEDLFEDPITTTPATSNSDVIVIGGKKKTWPWVTFAAGTGPISNPAATFTLLGQTGPKQIPPFTVALTSDIPDGLTVTVDPRPWSRGVYRNDGANYAGSLRYDTPIMRELMMRPGRWNVTFTGTDATGTSTCTVSWRTARSLP